MFICAMFSSSCKTRLLFHNTGAWPEDGKDAYFPDDSNGAIFSCASFYTSGDRVLLIPDAHIGLSDRPVPDARVTKAINHSAVRLNVLKYASLLRGDKTCLDRGSLHDCKPTCFMKYSLLFSRFASLFFSRTLMCFELVCCSQVIQIRSKIHRNRLVSFLLEWIVHAMSD